MSTFVDSYSVPLLLPSPILCRPFPIFFSLPVPSIDWIQPPAASPAASRQHAAPPRYPPLLLLMFFRGRLPSCLMLSDVVRGYWAENTEETLGWGTCCCQLPLAARLLLPTPGRREQATNQGRRRKRRKIKVRFHLISL